MDRVGQCVKIKAVQTQTTYPDLHMIFTRSILSSLQTSGHRLTQPTIPNPQPKHTYTHTKIDTLFGKGPGYIDWFVLTDTPRSTTCTLLLVDFIFHCFIFHRLAGRMVGNEEGLNSEFGSGTSYCSCKDLPTEETGEVPGA